MNVTKTYEVVGERTHYVHTVTIGDRVLVARSVVSSMYDIVPVQSIDHDLERKIMHEIRTSIYGAKR